MAKKIRLVSERVGGPASAIWMDGAEVTGVRKATVVVETGELTKVIVEFSATEVEIEVDADDDQVDEWRPLVSEHIYSPETGTHMDVTVFGDTTKRYREV